MRRSVAIACALAGALALAACGAGERPGRDGACARAGFSGGSSAADGVFFAVVPRDCSRAARAECAVADGTGVLEREIVPRGVVADCVAFNQFVGSGLPHIRGHVTGECFGRAIVRAEPALEPRTRAAPRACRVGRPRSGDAGPPPAPLVAAAGAPVIATVRVADPWGRAPESDAVGDRPPFVPPWTVAVWRGRDGSTCFEPGVYVDGATPGRSDELPGVRARGRLRRTPQVGSLRYDARSGPGIQLYGIGRFTAYPRREGATCAEPGAGHGVVVTAQSHARRADLSLGHTIVAGISREPVRRIAVSKGARRWRAHVGRAGRLHVFLVVARGTVGARGLRIAVTGPGDREHRFVT